MIIDCFLFFQELDLLEIRLEYLYPVVDKFLIIEAKQTFTGLTKEFIFEKNIKRYRKYIDKIVYYKIDELHSSNVELIRFLESSSNEEKKFIAKIIKDHRHYNKDNLSHVLDSYHRECIHLLLRKESKDEDTILLSDLDEIPNFSILSKIKKFKKINKAMVFVQNEFQYYLNNYSNSDWYGTIVAPYELIKNKSLNELRIKSKELPIIAKAGYHFTSVGSIESIINKIESWGHQEFNHKIVKKNIRKNIINGKDIFYRINRKDNKCIELKKSELFDKRMIKIISLYKFLILDKLDYNLFFNITYLYKLIFFNLIRISRNPNSLIKKISSFRINRKWMK